MDRDDDLQPTQDLLLRQSRASDILGNVDTLKPLTPNMRIILVELGEVQDFQPNVHLTIEGEESRGLYVILSGRAGVFKHQQGQANLHRLTTLEAGDDFGELSLFCPGPRSATVIAESDLKAFYLDHGKFLEFMAELEAEERNLLYEHVLIYAIDRLRRLNGEHIKSKQLLWEHALKLPETEE